jgi:hypothetical protein
MICLKKIINGILSRNALYRIVYNCKKNTLFGQKLNKKSQTKTSKVDISKKEKLCNVKISWSK